MEKRMRETTEKVESSKYKLTRQRREIIATVVRYHDRHLSAEELYFLVNQDYPEIGLATVYRTLDMLVDLGIVAKHDLGDGRARYELSSPERHHHHLICSACGRIIELTEDSLHQLERKLESEHDFTISDHRLEFYGLCGRCRREEE